MMDFITKGIQSFEMNAYLSININVDYTNIIKTDLQNRVFRSNLMRFQRIWGEFSLMNRCFK